MHLRKSMHKHTQRLKIYSMILYISVRVFKETVSRLYFKGSICPRVSENGQSSNIDVKIYERYARHQDPRPHARRPLMVIYTLVRHQTKYLNAQMKLRNAFSLHVSF